jgi:hypothetical protein
MSAPLPALQAGAISTFRIIHELDLAGRTFWNQGIQFAGLSRRCLCQCNGKGFGKSLSKGRNLAGLMKKGVQPFLTTRALFESLAEKPRLNYVPALCSDVRRKPAEKPLSRVLTRIGIASPATGATKKHQQGRPDSLAVPDRLETTLPS